MANADPTRTDAPLLGGRYALCERVGVGGMAEVYLAQDRTLGRDVAVKILHPERAADPTFLERFRREARAAARLNAPTIVTIYDWGSPPPGTPATASGPLDSYIVMEYVPGGNLSQVLEQHGPPPQAAALAIATQVATALEVAHQHGIIHRDIKPHNILLTAEGRVKVADFGIARAAGAGPLTRTREILGSAEYLSPEQAQGKPLDPRSDLYSLGVVLYQLLTGRLPFTAESPVALALRHVRDQPVPPRVLTAAITSATEAVVLKALAKDPAARYTSAAAMREALEEAHR